MLCPQDLAKILIFMPEAPGRMIANRLAEQGFKPVAISTVPEAFDALRSDEFAFAVTTRPNIDLLRAIRALPVVNIEVFFHAAVSTDGVVPVHSKQFDSKAFHERVEFLVQSSSSARSDDEAGRVKVSPVLEKPRGRWWATAANAFLSMRALKSSMNAEP
ncbi:hypothetical protein [Agrobacterium larrymoorei]|uniref:Uncharacterized protein n=1 Tax=Agrobacterium larrymoorei TaxID=160699 RepID=A0A4D7DXE7_9HYPH|nr:hypothetical protein [Agrobacterium larrymoorei]QCJ00959.1 hypothetical protein CFBP5473_23550 [Agrobacterium larrymoorei]QYA10297.1 hypothetical protein J5285_22220 [Agrobacterium larrymoorei]